MPEDWFRDAMIAELLELSTALERNISWLQGRDAPELLERAQELYERATELLRSLTGETG